MDSLPTEILIDIFQRGLEYYELKRIASVCKRFHVLLSAKSKGKILDKALFSTRRGRSPGDIGPGALHPALISEEPYESSAQWHSKMSKLSQSPALNENAVSSGSKMLVIKCPQTSSYWKKQNLRNDDERKPVSVGDVIRHINGQLHGTLRNCIETEGCAVCDSSGKVALYLNGRYGWRGIDAFDGRLVLTVEFQKHDCFHPPVRPLHCFRPGFVLPPAPWINEMKKLGRLPELVAPPVPDEEVEECIEEEPWQDDDAKSEYTETEGSDSGSVVSNDQDAGSQEEEGEPVDEAEEPTGDHEQELTEKTDTQEETAHASNTASDDGEDDLARAEEISSI